MRQNETQEKARLKIEMKLLQSLVQMETFFFPILPTQKEKISFVKNFCAELAVDSR